MTARVAAASPRSADLRLAALHVRTGSYALARVELETLAGADALDAAGVLDLAEVRWRTGDLAGAEAAAATWLDEASDVGGRETALANAICAEAAVARGDADAATAHVAAAAIGLATAGALEALLAGIVARAPWPSHDGGAAGRPAASGVDAGKPAAGGPAAAATGIGRSRAIAAGPPPVPAAASLVERGAGLLATEPERAAVLLALALRADRAAAEAVLSLLAAPDALPDPARGAHAAGRPGASTVAFVRAEALRAAGRHDEARIAYASAERLALEPAEAGPPGSAP